MYWLMNAKHDCSTTIRVFRHSQSSLVFPTNPVEPPRLLFEPSYLGTAVSLQCLPQFIIAIHHCHHFIKPKAARQPRKSLRVLVRLAPRLHAIARI